MNILIYTIVIVITVLADFISKRIVVANMELNDSIPLIKDVLHITYITNDGAAFGSMSDFRVFFMVASVVAILGIGVYLFVNSKTFSRPLGISFSLIIGGGIGNMIDRIFNGDVFGNGVVVDFIDFCAFPDLWMWIFNLADSFVCVGAGLFIFFYIREEIKAYKLSKLSKNISEEVNNDDPHTDN